MQDLAGNKDSTACVRNSISEAVQCHHAWGDSSTSKLHEIRDAKKVIHEIESVVKGISRSLGEVVTAIFNTLARSWKTKKMSDDWR